MFMMFNLMGENISTIKKSKVHTPREFEKGRRRIFKPTNEGVKKAEE
jgi:hypothetical protein